MAANLSIRASADRDRVATVLRENLAAGRLSTSEFDKPLEGAFAAKTMGELEGLMTDLPGTPRPELQAPRLIAARVSRRPRGAGSIRRGGRSRDRCSSSSSFW